VEGKKDIRTQTHALRTPRAESCRAERGYRRDPEGNTRPNRVISDNCFPVPLAARLMR
jgi:hypothetical protein